MSDYKLTLLLAAPLLVAAMPAAAYIGPGAGAGTIAIVLGILASVVMAFFAILWYPMKRLLKKRRPAPETAGSSNEVGPSSGS